MDGRAPWPMESAEAQRVYGERLDAPDYGNDINRGVCLHILVQYRKFEPGLSADDSMVRANTLLILISRTLNMMDKYIKSIGEEFAEKGGFRERLTAVRTEARAEKEGTPADAPACPQCGAPMRQRKTRKDNRPFWGCTQYPACRGVMDYGKQTTAVDSNRQQSTAAEKANA
jgi:four helix bundle suffix protein